MSNSFTLASQELTNKTITTTYKPSNTVVSYTYTVYKDGEVYETGSINKKAATNFIFDESGTYQIIVVTKDKNNLTKEEKSGTYQLDASAPKIVIRDSYLEMSALKENETFDIQNFKDNIIVYDPEEGNLFEKLTCDTQNIDFTKIGKNTITCTVSDEAGNKTEKEIILNITKDYTTQMNTLMALVVFLTTLVILYFLRFYRSTKLERKISPYAANALKDKRTSLFDNFIDNFYKIEKKLKTILQKSEIIKKHSKHFEKYIPLYGKKFEDGMDFITTKVIVGIIFVLISILSNIIRYKLIILYELLLPFCFGYLLPNVIFIVNYKIYKNKIENDLLQAIIIMNNAFKSGRSITQAIELVTKELKGPIGLEFKKMHMEISFGLSIEEVFKRLSNRIQIEEVTYLTASLAILNKTGGNIIKVFSSIEKTLFAKKRLKLELNSLTGSSKMIVYVLFLVPIFFILFISLISPSYFEPFYTTTLGFILMGIILTIYIIYIIVVNKVMKVRM